MSANTYSAWETGAIEVPRGTPVPSLGKLQPHEKLVLHRRRMNWTQRDVAKALACSRYHVNRMERGLAPCADLETFWKQ